MKEKDGDPRTKGDDLSSLGCLRYPPEPRPLATRLDRYPGAGVRHTPRRATDSRSVGVRDEQYRSPDVCSPSLVRPTSKAKPSVLLPSLRWPKEGRRPLFWSPGNPLDRLLELPMSSFFPPKSKAKPAATSRSCGTFLNEEPEWG